MVDGLGVWVRGLGFRGDFEGSLVSVIVKRNTLVGREYTRERIHSGENTLGREYTREGIHWSGADRYRTIQHGKYPYNMIDRTS